MKLTEDRITKLECPAGKKDVLVFDDVQRGLAVRITSSGGKTYLAQHTFGGSKRRIPLGAPTLALARSAAAKILGEGVTIQAWVSHFVIAPPLIVTREEIDRGIAALDKHLAMADAAVDSDSASHR